MPRAPHETSPDLATLEELSTVRSARRVVVDSDERTLKDQVELTEIPAPPFGEGPRGARVAELFREIGLGDVSTDEVGNVLGRVPGSDGGPPVVVAAHLDTVFPQGTDVTVRSRDGRWLGPGISDNGRGLAALLAVARAVLRAEVPLRAPAVFAATVGEEGLGDLRGVRHLFRDHGGLEARAFVSLDGAGMDRIVSRGLGSRRLRVTARGPGGHSWSDWGTPNPIHALGAAVGELAALELPSAGRTTLTVARWGGGTSVNAIPEDAWLELDVRSEDPERLDAVVREVRGVLEGAVDAAARRAQPARDTLGLEIAVLGDRPPGSTPSDHPLVEAAVAATRRLGAHPELVASSTDANIPMSRGIPALTLGGGGRAGRAHTRREWYSNDGGPVGILRALYTLLLVAGVEGR